MYDYQMLHKIPVELPKELIDKLDNIDECPNDLIPTEEKCYFCGHSLGIPKLVSSKAKTYLFTYLFPLHINDVNCDFN